MALHLIKLCVGADSVADLESWIAANLDAQKRRGQTPEQVHTTRMAPKRAAELLDGGSLYWVIKGQLCARQPLLDLRAVTDADGVSRCQLVLEPKVTPVSPRRMRPFQGWRYLLAHEAPPDLIGGLGEIAEMPDALRRELRELGLL